MVVAGNRVRMVGVMEHDPAPMEVGAEGEVTSVGVMGQFLVKWDNGRTLILLEEDPFVVI